VLREVAQDPDEGLDGIGLADVPSKLDEGTADFWEELGVLPQDLVEAQHHFVGEVVLSQFVVAVEVDEQGFADFGQIERNGGECFD
jgi:hypothetical protein